MSESEEEETREILSWRPGLRTGALPCKGGPKFFGQNDHALEEHKVDTQLKKYESSLRSQKVRKLCNLGRAEWIIESGVAKIVKQGKFIQSMGHHNGEFFALNGEEALFLLDIGDIELCLNDVPMALQEAFSLVFNNSKSSCTFDDYITFANLVKRGFTVQRFETTTNAKRKRMKRGHSDKSSPVSKKIEIDAEQPSTSSNIKGEETFVPAATYEDPEPKDECNRTQDDFNHKELQCRNWFLEKADLTSDQKEKNRGFLGNIVLPNLANSSCTHLPAPDPELVPSGIPNHDFFIKEIWFQRLKKDNGKAKDRTLHQTENYCRVSKSAKNWSEHKTMLKAELDDKKKRIEQMDELMHSGKIKPLLKRNDSLSKIKKIQIINEMKPKDFAALGEANKFPIKFNVYQCGSTPFKKTAPGRPFCRVVVTNVEDGPPDFRAILSLNHKSNGIPLKFAVVDSGQVSYYALENFEVENLL